MSSVLLSAPVRRPSALPSRQRSAAAWLLAAAVAIALIWIAMPRLDLDSAAATARSGDDSFAGGSFPVRTIERELPAKSHNRLVRVRCGGVAARTSFCWVSRA